MEKKKLRPQFTSVTEGHVNLGLLLPIMLLKLKKIAIRGIP